MGQRFEPGQSNKSTGSLDGMDEAKDIVENALVVRFLLETHQLDIDNVQAFAGLGEKIAQQFIHEQSLSVATHVTLQQFREPRGSLTRPITVAANGLFSVVRWLDG